MTGSADIVIAGAGPAGLIAAAAFAAEGASVLVADPAPRPDPAAPDRDLRSTAFLPPARALFERTGLWGRLAPLATPLQRLRIVDLAGDPPAIRTERTFGSAEAAAGPLAWNFMNTAFRREILAFLDGQPGVELAFGAGVAGLLNRTAEARITLTDGRRVATRLAVAADGRDSPLREAAGIGLTTRRYGQKALAFAVTHPEPHGNVSTELYLSGGPFTMVPLPDHQGRPASAIVWCMDGPDALARHAAPVDAFEAEATARSAGILGPLALVTGRALWSVVTQTADRLTEGRVALIAEAAHVLPPIGAQGLNTSVADILALAKLIAERPGEIGGAGMMTAYEAVRRRDIAARAAVLDLYNRLTRAPDPASQALRQLGLKAVHDIAPLRQGIMRAGSGSG